MELDSGPNGMALTKGGLLTWDVPSDAKIVAVIVSILNGSGQKIFHAFTVTVK